MSKSASFSSQLSPKYALMGFLYLQPMHGYELHRQLRASLSEVWRISQSQVYNILNVMQRDAWVVVAIQPQEKHPDRELFSLTKLGNEHFESWLYHPTPASVRAIRVEFLTRLFFVTQINPLFQERLISEQSAVVQEKLANLTQRLSVLPSDQSINRLGLELRIRELSTVLHWLKDCQNS